MHAVSAVDRVAVLDVVRGLAMAFVLLSHFATFGAAPFPAGLDPALVHYLYTTGMVASPTFMLMSGLTCAMLLSGSNPVRARARVLDRALFTLLVGHVFFSAIDILFLGEWRQSVYMTDTVAIALLAGTVVVPRLSIGSRALWGLVLLVMTWVVRLALHPSTFWLAGIYEMGVGPTEWHVLHIEFPVLPWFGVFLLGSAMEGWLSAARQAGRLRDFSTRILRVGALAVGTGALLKGAAWALRSAGLASADSIWMPFFAAYGKYPPSPVYLLLLGGAGLVLGGAVSLLATSRSIGWLPRGLAVFGRASLFTFMAQALVYIGFVRHAPWPLQPAWPLWFLLSAFLIWIAARRWDAAGGNRWMTLGYLTRKS